MYVCMHACMYTVCVYIYSMSYFFIYPWSELNPLETTVLPPNVDT